ncbi:acyloxyacyl hydrolase [Shinella sedimenti]|uniref:Acyloxyacyl hydrolase n=1 Tax=Shinella sedimenti TaxID=2919913 RepID=A0ABT0CTA0_9HYPH|nr:acyloxyacyl hydrolase [Shinella sedimenti]MCJ8151782.1 acyloxyacyl hydrolase [Shinella sedimenti]
MKLLNASLVIAPLALAPAFALAGDLVDEIRLGGSGIIDSKSSKDKGFVGSAEIYLSPFESSQTGVAKVLLEPRVQIGASAGASGTDQIYTGLNWHLPLGETFFAEAGIGGTVHNGNLDTGNGPRLGCRFLFREHVALGVKVTETVSVMATADHSSNANLCDGPNDGITHAGLAIGVKF